MCKADEVPLEEIEQDSVYQIYHKNLPPRTPVQLKSARVVMVSEKTDLNVTIRYPSSLSLKRYFREGTEMYIPDFDEKFVMGLMLASKVLYRQVSSQEFDANKDFKRFWLVESNSESEATMKNDDIGLARALKNNNEMLRWGAKKKIPGQHRRSITPYTRNFFMYDDTFNGKGDTFIRKHKEISDSPSTLGLINCDQEVKDQQEDGGDEIREVDHETEQEDDEDEAKEEEEEEVDEEDEDDNEKEQKSSRILRERKNVKQVKNVWHQVNKKPMKKCKKLVVDRWSKERYKAAELSLLESMQEKKATIGNPITRPALRVEARKRIGDTGLLDHLLKHVANKVAPGGKLRYRRSHNPDGAMEYWLEDADLEKIRKDAGVSDPFWIPPLGWKPGDSPTQDPNMAKEINHLKEEISFIKREYMPKKQFEEEMAGLRREIQELTSQNKQEQSQSLVVSEVVDTSPLQVIDICNLLPHSESDTSDVDNSVLKKGQCKKQLVVISDILKKIEAWMQASDISQETTQMDAAAKSPKADTLLITSTASSNAQKKPKMAAADEKNEAIAAPPKQPAGVHQEKPEKSGHVSPPPPPPAEGKAAKIERLKSGFRLCRPQGTFLWPTNTNIYTSSSATSNIMSSSQVTFQVEDMLQVVPTPPSVNSSTNPPLPPYHHHLNLVSLPVKPVPERRPVAVSSGHPPPTTTLNLNDIPSNPSSQQIVTTTAITPTIKLQQPFEAKLPDDSKKRKSPSSAESVSSDTSSCLSKTGTSASLADSSH
ncbi:protein DYAD-like [Rutidosis leptorrhynchoides]|uniref:protein DYAD-like n=1 Tax=Rutidosis leptorrhynchoides TaxID=125765 RepID=UPI003A997FE8